MNTAIEGAKKGPIGLNKPRAELLRTLLTSNVGLVGTALPELESPLLGLAKMVEILTQTVGSPLLVEQTIASFIEMALADPKSEETRNALEHLKSYAVCMKHRVHDQGKEGKTYGDGSTFFALRGTGPMDGAYALEVTGNANDWVLSLGLGENRHGYTVPKTAGPDLANLIEEQASYFPDFSTSKKFCEVLRNS